MRNTNGDKKTSCEKIDSPSSVARPWESSVIAALLTLAEITLGMSPVWAGTNFVMDCANEMTVSA